MAIDFYRGFTANGVRRGLTIPYGSWGPGVGPVYTGALAGTSSWATLSASHLRAVRFPGIVVPEKGARGSIPVPVAAAISDNSTITLTDGIAARIYEFDQNGSGVTVGDVAINIGASVTELDVATAFAAAINGDRNGGNIVLSAYARPGPGFVGARVALIQQFAVPGWVQVPNAGQTGEMTLAVVASLPGEWPGLPAELTGGRPTRPGVSGYFFFQGGPIRAGGVGEFYKGTELVG